MVTDWFGDTIPFGEQITFVCERGHYFEDDYDQIELAYTCQDGSNPDFPDSRGFFDIPEKEEDWPRCLLAVECPKPPDAPEEGVKEFLPIAIPQDTVKNCLMDAEQLTLKCHSFMNIFIKNLTYGRDRLAQKLLCDGEKKDNFAPVDSCFEDDVHQNLTELLRQQCHGHFECSLPVPTYVLTGCDGMRRELKLEHLCGM